jgi:hypothetical protein
MAVPVTGCHRLRQAQAVELFAGCYTFDQRHKLALYRWAFHGRIGAQKSQAERAIDKQQAIDFTRLAVSIKEKCHGDIECGGDLLQKSSASPVNAFLVFLDLLESDTEFWGKLGLGNFNLRDWPYFGGELCPRAMLVAPNKRSAI